MLKIRRLFAKRETSFPLAILKRNISTMKKILQDREFKEVEIPVPWGKIAGKHWGPLNVEPIIALHGWQDNAGAFDLLVRELPKDMSIVAFDYPGHGYSSWLPKGIIYTNLMYLKTIHLIKQYYGMKRIGLIAHSGSFNFAFKYSALFPQDIKFVVGLDHAKSPPHDNEKFLPQFAKSWEKFFEIEPSKANAPRYSEQEAINGYIKTCRNSVDEEMCKLLFVRGTTKHPDGTVSSNLDPRLQFYVFHDGLCNNLLKHMASRIQSPYALIEAENSHFKGERKFNSEVLKAIETHSSDFRLHTVPGTHHFHMTHTTNIAELMVPFIQKYL